MTHSMAGRIEASAKRYGWLFLLTAFLLGVYLLTLLPGVAGYGDIAKFQFVGKVLGTPHATGYPAYILITNLYSRLIDIGTLAYRMNLFSALCSVSACLVLFLIGNRLYNVRAPIAFASVAAFGLMQEVWRSSLEAEVYTLHLLLMTLVVYQFLKYGLNRDLRSLLLGGFVYAVSFGNHMTAITLLPALMVITLTAGWRIIGRPQVTVTLMLYILLGAVQYLYLPARYFATETTYLEAQAGDLGTVWYFVSGAQFRGLLFCYSISQVFAERVPLIAGMMLRDLGWGLLPALGGMFLLRPARLGAGIVAGIASVVFFCLNYGTAEINTYLIPAYMLLTIPIAVSLNWLYKSVRSYGKTVVALAIAALPISMLVYNYPIVNQSNNRMEAERIEQILATANGRALIIPSNYDTLEHLWYYIIGEGYQDRELYVLHRFESEQVYDYLKNGTPILLPEQRIFTPPGLDIYCMANGREVSLRETGLKVVAVDSLLYQVTLAAE